MRSLWSIAVLTLLLGCGAGQQHGHDARAEQTVVRVQTEPVTSREVPVVEEFAGTLKVVNSASLSTRLSGWITYLRVQEGDVVHRGETLVRVEAGDLLAGSRQAGAGYQAALAQVSQATAGTASARSALAQARAGLDAARARLPEGQAQLSLAQTEYRRVAHLYELGALPRRDFDQAEAALEVARARLDQLKAGEAQARAGLRSSLSAVRQAEAGAASMREAAEAARSGIAVAESPLRYATVTSPLDGYVVRKLAHEGELTNPGQVLLEVQDIRNLWLEIPVPESRVGLFSLNQRVDVRVDAVEGEFSGPVRHIVPASDPASRSFVVKIELTNPGRLLPGMYGRVRVESGKRELVAVPPSAVVVRGELEGVFVVDSGRVRYRLVKLGGPVGNRVEVLTGLPAGERLVLDPSPTLRDGGAVVEGGAP